MNNNIGNLFLKSTAVVLLVLMISVTLIGSGIAPSAYNLIENSGSALVMRSTLNFVNGGCVDNPGQLRTDCTLAVTSTANASCAFTNQTSVTCTHNLGTTNVLVDVYNAASPPAFILPTSITIISANAVTVTFSSSQSGTIVVNGSTSASVGGGTNYQTIKVAGVSQPTEPALNFASGVTCTDTIGVSTNCTPTSSFSAKPPYLFDGTNYIVGATGYIATRPSASPMWLNGVAPGTVTAGTNGDIFIKGQGQFFASLTATTSAEAVFVGQNLTTTGTMAFPYFGIWLWDSTNNIIWTLEFITPTGTLGEGTVLGVDSWTYNGSGNPVDVSTAFTWNFVPKGIPVHLKMSVAGGTLTFSESLDGGVIYSPFAQTESVGTISKGGYFMAPLSPSTGAMDVYSLVVN